MLLPEKVQGTQALAASEASLTLNDSSLPGSEHKAMPRSGIPRTLKEWLTNCSFNDWLILTYVLLLDVHLLVVPPSADKTTCLRIMLTMTFVFVACVFIGVRGRLLPFPQLRAFVYRAAQLCTVQGTYFAFARYLPTVSPHTLDVELLALDMRWFGVEPAFFFDQFVTAYTTEWFAFFYYGYFFLIAGHLLPILFFGKDPLKTAQFLLGMLLVSTLGQSIYAFVPGFGPHHAFADSFEHALPPGLWWRIVTDLVAASGAQKDIFPSLHTAVPGFILLYSYHYRGIYPYRATWRLVAFSVFNIVIATLFLRWHYLIDVIAGWALACIAYVVAIWLPAWERPRRLARGHGEIWPDWNEQL